jgi:ABC-type polysaccharide/polyol phosphate export permease
MTRRVVRIIWVLTGVCLAASVIAGVIAWLGPPDQPWHRALFELSTLIDIVAFLLWMGIFAIYWARLRRRS